MALSAAKYMWKTNFVVLALLNGPILVTSRANESLDKTGEGQPRLSDIEDSANIMITADAEFQAAVGAGEGEVSALLKRVENMHFRRLAKAIEPDGASQ
jgi:hypothetical protein